MVVFLNILSGNLGPGTRFGAFFMQETILRRLRQLEDERQIRILLAVESGSRAWGFASRDSDWDVRLIYVHPPEWYLTIDDRKDNFEVMEGDLDFAGWELRKALRLFRKSNPPMMEWLQSPLVYHEAYSTASRLRRLAGEFFVPKACLYHYFHMAQNNFRQYLQGEFVKSKKYFYVLRPILACQWIESTNTMPPMEFDRLVQTQVSDADLKTEIETLLARKRAGDELDLEPQNPILHAFLSEKVAYFQQFVTTFESQLTQPDTAKLNQLFRQTLEEVRST